MTYYQTMKRALSVVTDRQINTALKYFDKGYRVYVGESDAAYRFYQYDTGFG